MRKILLALTIALASAIAAAATPPSPGGPFQGSQIDAKDYLLDKTVDFSVARSLPYRFPNWVAFENVVADNERLLVLMGWKSGKGAKFEPVAIVPLTTVEITKLTAPAEILIDGNGGDWEAIPSTLTDPVGDSRAPAVPGTDLVSLKLARDETYLYARIGLANGPGDTVMYVFELMQYYLQLQTPGDVLVNCARHGGQNNPMQCLVHDRNGAFRAQYGLGYVAEGNGFLEWRIPISDLAHQLSKPFPMFPVSGKLDRGIDNRFIRLYAHPMNSDVADEVDWYKRPLIIHFYD